jgi:hypothetical protein
MKFTIGGTDYNGAAMQRVDTGDRSEPIIYMDRDCQIFVVRNIHGVKAVSKAYTEDIHQLFQKHHVRPVLCALH